MKVGSCPRIRYEIDHKALQELAFSMVHIAGASAVKFYVRSLISWLTLEDNEPARSD